MEFEKIMRIVNDVQKTFNDLSGVDMAAPEISFIPVKKPMAVEAGYMDKYPSFLVMTAQLLERDTGDLIIALSHESVHRFRRIQELDAKGERRGYITRRRIVMPLRDRHWATIASEYAAIKGTLAYTALERHDDALFYYMGSSYKSSPTHGIAAAIAEHTFSGSPIQHLTEVLTVPQAEIMKRIKAIAEELKSGRCP
ncbi:MAG: hypothetical protein KGH64_01155 [Candidatus Micrarchaeota archaeon]|nr:hypothetical protein [Candidatus Micrarchaeota archaeon]